MAQIVCLVLGGAVGTLSRYFLGGIASQLFGKQFPYGTLIVNLLGCFLIGVLTVLSEEKLALSPNARLLLIVGFCGAFTTFSTYILESANLIRDGESLRAFLYVAGSVALGFFCFRFGVLAAKVV